MRAIIAADEPGADSGPRFIEMDPPTPRAGQVLLAVGAAGVNRIDLLQAEGRYELPPGVTSVLGVEVAGTVVAVGPGPGRWCVGDAVCGLVSGGAYADFVVADQGDLLPVPTTWTAVEAATLPEAYATAWYAVVSRGRMSTGMTVLVHGGASAVGLAAAHIARRLEVRLIASCSTTVKAQSCLDHGAWRAVVHGEVSPWQATGEATGGEGVDLIIDNLGADNLDDNLAALAPCGILVSIGSESGDVAGLRLGALRRSGLTLTGFSLRALPPRHRTNLLAQLGTEMWPAFEQREIEPVLAGTYAMQDVGSAHAAMRRRDRIGKVVLDINQSIPHS